jgi:hypothetical protein
MRIIPDQTIHTGSSDEFHLLDAQVINHLELERLESLLEQYNIFNVKERHGLRIHAHISCYS